MLTQNFFKTIGVNFVINSCQFQEYLVLGERMR